MGNRDNIDEMSSTNSSLFLSILKMIEKYDIYGQVAYPKHHKQSDDPDIYRLATKTKGVFINLAFIEPFGLTFIEVATFGLPMVDTKNGGPIDIHRVLDNGLLVDPHDQQAVVDDLLKLVADKQLWAKCSCKPRQPLWLRTDDDDDDDNENSKSDSPIDSLRDIQDISLNLRFSLDGEKNCNKEHVDNTLDLEVRKGKLENVVLSWSKEDCDASSGLSGSVKDIFEAVEKERAEGSIRFFLSSSFNISEVQSFLVSEGMNPTDFDAYICNSAGELYYSSFHSEQNPFVVDLYYHSHIEYRWGAKG
ncbi:putative sucrose-phosphate synthase 1 [Capsicum chinense]|nr:putative sucrose-phosphate synthase 1 [Capsicum chinense]